MEEDSRRRFVFHRGRYLYAAMASRRGVHGIQRLADVTALVSREWDEKIPRWSVSPDGKRIAFRGGSPTDPAGSFSVHIASLPDLKDRRVLFTTTHLQDARGRPVTLFPPFVLLPHQATRYPLPEPKIAGMWRIEFLRWSGEGRRLYISMRYDCTLGGYATCAIDTRTGRAVTDTAGNWRRFLQTDTIDENERYLVGIGLGRTLDEPDVCNGCSRYSPLYIVPKCSTVPINLLPARFTSKKIPPYAHAECCTIAPGGERIAFVSNKSLWLTSVRRHRYERLLSLGGDISRLAWIDGATLMYHRPNYPAGSSGSLWRLALRSASSRGVAGTPRLLLHDVECFEGLTK